MEKTTPGIKKARSGDDAMNRYAGGDDAAFAELHAAVTPRLTRFLGRRLRNRAILPDLVQETMLRVHRARRSFVRGSAVMPWVLAIARRQLIDAHRCSLREEQSDADRLDQLAGRAALQTAANGEEIVAAKQLAARLNRAFSAVSEPQRAALRLVKGEGLSIAEAAAALGTTTTGIKLRTHRACRALRAELANEGAAA